MDQSSGRLVPAEAPAIAVSRSLFERHPRKTLSAIVLILAIATDFAFARAERYLSPRRAAPNLMRVRSEVFHHGLAPLLTVRDPWGPRSPTYATNSFGLRDETARTVPPATDRRRVMFIGDSFTEGIGVEYDRTFVGLVAKALAPRAIEVLNAGCASYSPIIYYRKVRDLLEKGLRFDELVVFVDIGDVQDEVTYLLGPDGSVVSDEVRRIREERQNIRYSLPPPLRNLTLRQFLKRNTVGLFFLYEGLENRLRSEAHRAALWTVEPRLYEEFGREGLARGRGHMDDLAGLLRARGIRLTVAVYPWPDQIRRGDLHSLHVAFWSQWAGSKGAAFLDCFPPFFDPRRGDVLFEDFIPGDIHWNEAGHRLIADAFLGAYSTPP